MAVDRSVPTWTIQCHCGQDVSRFWGESDVQCPGCGAWYNAGGQRLRDDWQDNPAWQDDDISDLEGFEIQQLRKEGEL